MKKIKKSLNKMNARAACCLQGGRRAGGDGKEERNVVLLNLVAWKVRGPGC